MEILLEKIASALLFMLGVTMMYEPLRWADFYSWLLQQGSKGRFVYAGVSIVTGLCIILFHDVWQGIPMALTILGWMAMIDGAMAILFPTQVMTTFAVAASGQANGMFRALGVVFVLVAGLLAAHVWLGGSA